MPDEMFVFEVTDGWSKTRQTVTSVYADSVQLGGYDSNLHYREYDGPLDYDAIKVWAHENCFDVVEYVNSLNS